MKSTWKDRPRESPLVWGHHEVTLAVLSSQEEEGPDDRGESPMVLFDDQRKVPVGVLPNARTLFFAVHHPSFQDKTHGETEGRQLGELVHEVIVEDQVGEWELLQLGVFSSLVGH